MATSRIIVCHWDTLASALHKRAPGVHVASARAAACSRWWTTTDGLEFEIVVHASAAGATGFYDPPQPRIVASLGDHAVYDECHRQLVWRYRNIGVILGVGSEVALRPLADAIQDFLASQPAYAPDAVLPRFHHDLCEPVQIAVGESMWVAVDNLQPGDLVLVSNVLHRTDRDGRVEIVMKIPGRRRLSLSTTNVMTLINTPPIHIEVDCAMRDDAGYEVVTTHLLPHAAVTPDGALAFAAPTDRGDVSLVYAIELGTFGLMFMGLQCSTWGSAPLDLVARLTEPIMIAASGAREPFAHELRPTPTLYALTGTILAFEREYRVEAEAIFRTRTRSYYWQAPPGVASATAALLRRRGIDVPPECERTTDELIAQAR